MWAIISAAGWPIWPLIFASVVAVAIVLERIWALRSNVLFPNGLVADVCKSLGQFKDPQNLVRLSKHSALGDLLSAGIAARLKGSDHEDAMQVKALGLQQNMEKHLDLLSLIASASPLMGLLGTVVGMIEIFAVQGASNQTPEALAAGISVALYNTAFGLIVAIPALVAYRLFKMRINTLMNRLEILLEPFEETMNLQTGPKPVKKAV